MSNANQTPMSRDSALITQNVAGLILSLMRPKNQVLADELAGKVIAEVTAAWTQLVAAEPQAGSWSANARYIRTVSLLEENAHDANGWSRDTWSTEPEIARYLVWALSPIERAELGVNLLHGPKAALETKLATYLASRGEPKAGDSIYGWQDSDKQFHTRTCPIVHISEVCEDKWDEFADTFSPNSTQHGLAGRGACRCGYIDGELRVRADLSQLLGQVLRG